MCPNCAHVVEAEGEIEKKKQFRIHGARVDYQFHLGNKLNFALLPLM
jgi:hypothetical protein